MTMLQLTATLIVSAALPTLEMSVPSVNVTVPGERTTYLEAPCDPPGGVEYLTPDSSAVLTCQFRLGEGQWLDSVKWYLNSSEIYRIVPSLTQQDRSVFVSPIKHNKASDCPY